MSRAAEWSVRVAEWRASGLTSKEFCKEREYSAQHLLYWSSTLRRKGTVQQQQRPGRDVTLARVVRRDHREQAVAAPAAIVVRTKRARVEVRPGVDQATLAAVFAALGAIGSGP
jgi:hypothetical protein